MKNWKKLTIFNKITIKLIQSKVFRDFLKVNIMNNKIIILISLVITITIAIVTFSTTQVEIIEEESKSYIEESDQIGSVLQKIKEDKIKNDNSENPYKPKEKEWINSGPFFIDRSEYWLGEKTFINIDEVDEGTKGEMVFTKIINNTHSKIYKKIAFDGSKPQNNFYLGFYPSEFKGFCSTNELVGDWEVIFAGTNFSNLKFKIIDRILPGMEDNYQSVC